jgi:hypothetical protein
VAAARRRAHIRTRTASLRTLGTAGAITALGVFTGLAAAHSPASTKPAAIAPPVTDNVAPASSDLRTPSDDGAVPDDQGGFDERQEGTDAQAAEDFFAQQSQSNAAPVQRNASPVQSNASPVQRNAAPAPRRRTYVAPPLPAAPPAATSSTS